MKWSPEAEDALKRVPFFVRKRVRARVEKEAQDAGKDRVALADVKATQTRYLSGMQAEIKGYQLDTCFGPSGCPNRAVISDPLLARIEALIKAADLLSFLKSRVKGDLKFHHEFRATLADCPNACSQPQIKDIGIIGARVPETTGEACSQCGACNEACSEMAITLSGTDAPPRIDPVRCLNCGQCIRSCATGTIAEAWCGYRVQIGGRLGRHPRLARELPGIFNEDQVIEILQACLELYKTRSRNGERFAHLFQDKDFEDFSRRFCMGAAPVLGESRGFQPR
jgi:dissimilatory sulfite reductase (desulfoviridin) alpha/beta subunit